MEIILKCAGIALCGMGIGAAAMWMLRWRPKPISQREARRRAEALYNRLMAERGWSE